MAGKRVENYATTKVARQWLNVLAMAKTLGDILEACRGVAWIGQVFTNGSDGSRRTDWKG